MLSQNRNVPSIVQKFRGRAEMPIVREQRFQPMRKRIPPTLLTTIAHLSPAALLIASISSLQGPNKQIVVVVNAIGFVPICNVQNGHSLRPMASHTKHSLRLAEEMNKGRVPPAAKP
jgi:hypothetical protein